METIRTIMVAIGFSSYSKEIFTYAAGLATQFDADLLVASIINARDVEAVGSVVSMGYDVKGEDYVSAIKQERRSQLDSYIDDAAFPAERVRSIFKVGNPLEELLRITVRENVQMLVMGVKGRTDLEQLLVGSIAERLFRRSPVTIVSYRDEKTARRLRKRIHP